MVNARGRALRDFVEYLNDEHAAAPQVARDLLASPDWGGFVATHRHEFTYGVVDYLLDVAHQDLDADVSRAMRLTQFLLRHLRYATIPPEPSFLSDRVRGIAWKEHGSALRALGRNRSALAAARRAVAILSRDRVLRGEHTFALVLQAHIWMNLGDRARALTLFLYCRHTFEQLGDDRGHLQMLMFEAAIVYEGGDVGAARDRFVAAQRIAATLGDDREAARLLNNIGHCEIRLHNHDAALHALTAARDAFTHLGMFVERQRAVWGIARVLRDAGRLEEALRDVSAVRDAFLARGAIVAAADAGIDALEMLAAAGDERVVELALELVNVFTRADLHRELRIALAYIADQARFVIDAPGPFQISVVRVRGFLQQLDADGAASFLAPDQH